MYGSPAKPNYSKISTVIFVVLVFIIVIATSDYSIQSKVTNLQNFNSSFFILVSTVVAILITSANIHYLYKRHYHTPQFELPREI